MITCYKTLSVALLASKEGHWNVNFHDGCSHQATSVALIEPSPPSPGWECSKLLRARLYLRDPLKIGSFSARQSRAGPWHQLLLMARVERHQTTDTSSFISRNLITIHKLIVFLHLFSHFTSVCSNHSMSFFFSSLSPSRLSPFGAINFLLRLGPLFPSDTKVGQVLVVTGGRLGSWPLR